MTLLFTGYKRHCSRGPVAAWRCSRLTRRRASARGHKLATTAGALAALSALVFFGGLASGLHVSQTDVAEAANFHKCNTVHRARQFKIKKIKATAGVQCSDARKVTKKWVKRKFDQNNAIRRNGSNWFCTWRKRDLQSVNTGTGDCEAGATDEIRYVVRKR